MRTARPVREIAPALPHPNEHQEQAALVDTVLYVYQHRSDFKRKLFFAVLNGVWIAASSKKGKQALIAKYKKEGWLPGVADLLYLQPRGPYPYLAIEMKTPEREKEKDGGVSPDQREWLQAAKEVGAMVAVCYGRDAAWEVFTQYMSLDLPE